MAIEDSFRYVQPPGTYKEVRRERNAAEQRLPTNDSLLTFLTSRSEMFAALPELQIAARVLDNASELNFTTKFAYFVEYLFQDRDPKTVDEVKELRRLLNTLGISNKEINIACDLTFAVEEARKSRVYTNEIKQTILEQQRILDQQLSWLPIDAAVKTKMKEIPSFLTLMQQPQTTPTNLQEMELITAQAIIHDDLTQLPEQERGLIKNLATVRNYMQLAEVEGKPASYATTLSVSQIADKTGISPSHIKRLIHSIAEARSIPLVFPEWREGPREETKVVIDAITQCVKRLEEQGKRWLYDEISYADILAELIALHSNIYTDYSETAIKILVDRHMGDILPPRTEFNRRNKRLQDIGQLILQPSMQEQLHASFPELPMPISLSPEFIMPILQAAEVHEATPATTILDEIIQELRLVHPEKVKDIHLARRKARKKIREDLLWYLTHVQQQ